MSDTKVENNETPMSPVEKGMKNAKGKHSEEDNDKGDINLSKNNEKKDADSDSGEDPMADKGYDDYRSVEEAMKALGLDEDFDFDDEDFDMEDLQENITHLEKVEAIQNAQKRKHKKDKKKVNLGKFTNSPSTVGWYKNWVVDWDDDDEDETDEDLSDDELSEEEEEAAAKGGAVSESFIKKKAKKRFGDVWQLVETYCEDWEDSALDIATFFFCLAAFQSGPPKEKEEAIYNEELILSGYHWAQFAFAAYKGEKALVLERLPFLDEQDFIQGNWDVETLGKSPAYYISVDHDQKKIVVSLRGTKVKQDILIDLAAQFTKWRGGFVHFGFLAALKELEPQISPVVSSLKDKYENYDVVCTGHSMGAAVSALLALQWHEEYPHWNVTGYGYATPCVVSYTLLEESKSFFTTYVHNYDAVSRISMGSIQDMHNGMRLFTKQVGNNHNVLAIFQALRKIATKTESNKVVRVAGEINQIIQNNLNNNIKNGAPSHLFPAGETYQLWRETRGVNFTTWELYKTNGTVYGQIRFSPSMLKDHGSAGYNAAFENLLTLSVVESKVWLGLTQSRRQEISQYWNSFPADDPFADNYDTSFAVENMKKDSQFRQKAMRRGLIRPFLLLVSMSPKRRAAMAYLMGITLMNQIWYREFDPHHEAWYMLTCRKRGLQTRATSVASHIPFKHKSNWYMILHKCAEKIRKKQKKYIDDEVNQQMKGKKKVYRNSIRECKDSGRRLVPDYEESVMLLFFDLVEPNFSPNGKDIKKNTQTEESKKERKEYSEEKQEAMRKLEELGFHNENFLSIVADQVLDHSSYKKANEMYAWGEVIRREDERVKKREVAAMGGLAFVSAVLFLGAIPTLVVAPPVALLPLGAGIGIGTYVFGKSHPGGLVSVVVGCLQQRLALAMQGEPIEKYY
eukprot:CAMPEP_0206161132 /NCGR_PEP_ID=MMETSP1474-20131121/7393_1 /ASSEMBLY_ACC=CAM_ASM_001110 /TAXON_ID=97495 /ORGANISM="Imantonia sp., Strain RCC918" /LENGTH=908 /DNA_ID=CAMNT_0053562861 /DNA_START=30 /DNA_END=2756 /DNA_ORIENTATION=+